MPQTYQFASKTRDHKIKHIPAVEQMAPGGSMVATKEATWIQFKDGFYSTTSKDQAEYIRSRIESGNSEVWEVSPHAQAESESSILTRVSELQLKLHTENHEDAVAGLREIYQTELDTVHRDAVTAPLERIFKTLEISPRKPGRPAGK